MGELDVTPEDLARAQERSRRHASAEGVAAGLADARATLAEIWRRLDDAAARDRAMQAMTAVIAAEATMHAADALLLAPTPATRAQAYERLRIACILRTGAAVARSLAELRGRRSGG